jgi:hypothetical protein
VAEQGEGEKEAMPECGQRAVLIITKAMEGTATNVARDRRDLCCTLPSGHPGSHHDAVKDEHWESAPGSVRTLLRDEDEPKS